MDAIIDKLPYIGAFLMLVLIFLAAWQKECKRSDDSEVSRQQFDIARMKELERIGAACHAHTKELNERVCTALDKNQVAYDRVSTAIGANVEALRAFERRLNGGQR